MSARDELNQIIEFAGRPPKGVKTSGSVTKFISKHGGKLAAGAGIAAGVGLTVAASRHLEKQKQWRANAGDKDFLDLAGDLVVDKHGAMLPKNHPSVVGGNIQRLSARQQLDQIINFDAATMIADKLGKVAWGKIGQGALRYGGMGAIGGAVIGGAQGAANGDIVGGAASGAMSGGMLGAAGGALHSAGAFKGLMGTEEQIAARAAKKAAAGNAAAPAAKVAAPTTGQEGYRAAAQARMAGTDELKGSFSGNPAASNTSVADAIAANQAKTARAKGIAEMYGAKGAQSGAPASATQAADSMASRQGALGNRSVPQQPALGNRSVPQQPAQAAANVAQPQASGVQAGRRFKNADEAVRSPVNEDAWNKLDPNIRNRARGVANLHNDPGYQGDKTAAAARYHDMRERHGFSAREELDSIIQLAAWTRKEGKSRSGGLNEKGRKSYERENPGSDLKAPSKEAGNPRRASFCARMSGMKKKLTSSKTANDPGSRINKSLKAWNCSAREELNTILFAKKGGDYKRHWSQKKTDRKGKKKRADRGETPCECHTYSAREELEVIQFGNAMPDQLSDEQKTSLWAHLQKKGITKDRLRDTVLKMRKATAANQQLSARDQLNTILMGADVRPRDPMGRFDQAEDGAPNPQHMKVTYGTLAAGAAGGAAFQGGGMGLKALVEKLKAVKKK